MHPLAHLEHQAKTHRRRKANFYIANIAGLLFLIATSMLIAPMLHEGMHMLFLELKETAYTSQIELTVENGLTGRITPLDGLGTPDSIVLLAVGAASNLLVGILLFALGFIIMGKKRHPESIFSTYLAVGFIYDPMTYCFANEGDLINILGLLDMNAYIIYLPLVGLCIIGFIACVIHHHSKQVFREYHVLCEEIEKLESFLDIISVQGSRQS